MSKEENDVEKLADSKAQKKSKHNDGAADLEKVTDYEEERMVMSQDITGVSFLNMCTVMRFSRKIRMIIRQ